MALIAGSSRYRWYKRLCASFLCKVMGKTAKPRDTYQ